MILECPNCETCYEIPEDLPPEGRKVRCASCQHVWNATLENQPKPDLPPEDFTDEEIVFKNDEEMAGEAAAEPEPAEEEGNSQGSVDDLFAQDLPEEPAAEEEGNSQGSVDDLFAQDLPEEPAAEEEGNSQGSVDDLFAQDEPEEETPPEAKAVVDNDSFADPGKDDPAPAASDGDENFSESAMEEAFSSAVKDTEEAESPPIVIGKVKKRTFQVQGNVAAGWAALALMLSGVMGFVYFDRISVVRILPGSAATYESLGMPVNVRGLEFDKIKYSWETSSGRPVLEVFGDIVNVTSEPLKVPTVVFGLRTKEKVEVYQWAADVRSELLPGGQRTAFTAQIPTPPNSIRDVQVRFAKVR